MALSRLVSNGTWSDVKLQISAGKIPGESRMKKRVAGSSRPNPGKIHSRANHSSVFWNFRFIFRNSISEHFAPPPPPVDVDGGEVILKHITSSVGFCTKAVRPPKSGRPSLGPFFPPDPPARPARPARAQCPCRFGIAMFRNPFYGGDREIRNYMKYMRSERSGIPGN